MLHYSNISKETGMKIDVELTFCTGLKLKTTFLYFEIIILKWFLLPCKIYLF